MVDTPACPPPGALRLILPAPRGAAAAAAGRKETVSTRTCAPLSPRTPLTPHFTVPCPVGYLVLILTSGCPTPWDSRIPAGHGRAGGARPARRADAGRVQVRPACGTSAGRARPGGPAGGAANVRSVLHAIGGVISAAVVLAAFWAAVRLLAGRAFRRAAYPRRLLGPRRRGAVTLRLARLAGRVLMLAARFAVGAPLGKRRTDATFLSRGTRPVGGVPGWFTTGQPGRWAYLPGWQRAAVRWAAVAAAIGLYARPLITAAVLGGLAVAAGAALALQWRRAWYVRAVVRPVYLQLCGYLGTDPAASPLRWLDVPRGFTAIPDAVVTLTYPAAWNPDAAKQKNIDEVIRRHLGGDLAGTFGPHAATWRHPPAPPARALFDGYTQPAHRIHLATLPGGRKWIADLENEEPHLFIAAGTGGGKTATAARRRRARPRARLADRHHRPQTPLLHRPQNRRRRAHQRARHPRAHRHRGDDVGAGRVLPVHARRQHRRRRPRRLAGRVPAADAGHR